ncbi:MAG: transposase [Methanobrevibacter sp. CfCl-M3]
MKVSLYYDENDPKWILLSKVLEIFDYRETHQELSKNGIVPLDRAVNILKVVMVALFFDLEVSYTVSELLRNKELKEQLMIDEIYSENQIYEFLSRFSEIKFYEFTIKLLNKLNFKNTRGLRSILVDGTDLQIDLNWFGRRISKKSLDKKPYKWGYSSSKGYYIGLKLTLAIDYETMQPVGMLIHEGSPNDAKI